MKEKIIKDLVHGYITVDENICRVIDQASFQRLKGISQLTANHLYPSANHTRFEHSLGVMDLAIKFYNQIEKSLIEKVNNYKKVDKNYFDYLKVNLQYASLLHDIGHGPLSHLGESFYDKNEIINKTIGTGLAVKEDFNNGSKHEIMSCFIISKNFSSVLSELKGVSDLLDYHFIFRIITGTKYSVKSEWDKNIIIEILNSQSVDVDKLDYLIRDNFMTGSVAPKIDIERLILSLTIDPDYRLSFTPMGIPSLISIKDSRDFLYLWVYNHHTVVYTDFLYKTAITHLANPENTFTIPENKFAIEDFFSTKAISENLISDYDIFHALYKEYKRPESEYSKKILPQLLERKFLKPIWKTIDAYKLFMSENFSDRIIFKIEEYINDSPETGENSLGTLVTQTMNEANSMLDENSKISEGELFIIKRSNKFYSMNKNSKFFIYYPLENSIKSLDKVMPPREYDKIYSEIAFYIFSRSEVIEKVKIAFCKVMNSLYYD